MENGLNASSFMCNLSILSEIATKISNAIENFNRVNICRRHENFLYDNSLSSLQ